MDYLLRLAALACLLLAPTVHSDAIMRSQAMFADTIVEIYVEEAGVRVELEIGMRDIASFRNLLPDAIYEGMEFTPRPYTERLAEFFSQDLLDYCFQKFKPLTDLHRWLVTINNHWS